MKDKRVYTNVSKQDQDIIARCETAREESHTADSDNRKQMLDDLKFCALDQWPQEVKDKSENKLFMLTLDKVNQGVKAVVGEMRENRPSIRALPVDDEADVETAKTFSGLIRTIEQTSNATNVYLRAGAMQVKCGYGLWRVEHQYASHDVFEQDLFIKYVKNPLNWWPDPRAQELTKHDGRYWVGLCQMHKEEFKKQYPEVDTKGIDQMFDGEGFGEWIEDDDIIYCEFYEKRPKVFTLCLLSNGHTVNKEAFDPTLAEANGVMILKEREVDSYEITYQKVTGNAVFDKQVLPTKYYPIIPVYGEIETIEGEDKIRGLVRPAKDPQRLYNYAASADVEQMALQPKAPFLVTAKMIAKWKRFWDRANTDNLPYLPITPDEKMPGFPQRSQPPVASTGLLQRAQIAQDDIRSSMGVHEASYGQESNAISGKAKLIEQQSGSLTNSIYMDNLSLSIEHTGRVLIDMIPSFYDTMRLIRITGEDGQEEEVYINRPYMSPDGKKIENDLTRGKYDVRTSVGPSYRTRRQQAVDTLYQLAQTDPRVMQFAGDILAKNLDIPYADELEERFRKLIAMQAPGLIEEKDPEKRAQLEQQQMQANQQQQQAVAIQLKDVLSKIEETQSKTEENKSQAMLNQAKIAEVSENAEIEKLKLLQQFLAGTASTTPQ